VVFVAALISVSCAASGRAQQGKNISSHIQLLDDLARELERAKRRLSELENANRELQPEAPEDQTAEGQSGSPASPGIPERSSPRIAPPVVGSAPRAQELSPEQQQQLAKAEQLLRQGDIQGARLLLEYLLATGNPLVAFKLAETYDPNRLATWKAFGVRADFQKARELYQRAQAGGINNAQDRFSGLR
jgi:hypothetical protein